MLRFNDVKNVAPLSDENAFWRSRIGNPDRAVCIQANAIRPTRAGLSPDTAVGQVSVGVQIKRRQASAESFSDDQRPAIRCNDRAIGKVHVAGSDADNALGRNARKLRRFVSGQRANDVPCGAFCKKIQAKISDKGPTVRANNHVIAVKACDLIEVGVHANVSVRRSSQ